jgi:ribosomal protein L15E
MYTSPIAHLQIAYDKQREWIEQAERHRALRQLRDHAKTARSTNERPQRSSWRGVLRLRTPASA